MARIIGTRLICTIVVLFAVVGRGAAGASLHALLVGGGPDRENNTAQIEEHLRFVTSLVPASPGRIVLFADGKAGSKSLSFTDTSRLTDGLRALDVLLPNDGLGSKLSTRAPVLGVHVNGPSRLPPIERSFSNLAALSRKSGPPVLLYFAGHGSQGEGKEGRSLYNLWGGGDLDPATLSRLVACLPSRVPVTLVMAQCFSGGFADVLFTHADASLSPISRPFIGFFAAEADREAAGCGTETNSPLYQDFSSYFFGALCGRDKLGQPVAGADYDGDGKVSCHEAWCYAMIHDESIDTPVCTSLIYLRQYVTMNESEILTAPWQQTLDAATPAETAALNALSARLGLDGNDRILAGYDRLMFSNPVASENEVRAQRESGDHLNTLRMEQLRELFAKLPALRWRTSKGYPKAAEDAAAFLQKDTARSKLILSVAEESDKREEQQANAESMLVRFTDLIEAVQRRKWLREKGTAKVRDRFELIFMQEQQGLEGLTPGRLPQ